MFAHVQEGPGSIPGVDKGLASTLMERYNEEQLVCSLVNTYQAQPPIPLPYTEVNTSYFLSLIIASFNNAIDIVL